MKAEHKAPITEDCFIPNKLLVGTDCKMLVDMVASKSFMSKTFNLNCLSLQIFTKVLSKTKNILVGSGQYVGVLFVIHVVINLQGHKFEVYILVSEIHDNVDMVMGIRNVYEIEGVINATNFCGDFLNKSIPFIFETDVLLMPSEQRLKKLMCPL